MSLKSAIIASVSAAALGLFTLSAPADAAMRMGGGGFHGGGFHGGGGWHGGGWHGGGWHGGGWHGGGWGGGWGWGAAGLGLGLAAGALAYPYYGYGYGYDDGCYRYRPIYDQWGNYIGQRPVNVCY